MSHPLKVLRHKHGLTQKILAQRAKLSPRTVSYIETRKEVPRYSTRKKILRVFGLSFREFHQRVFDP